MARSADWPRGLSRAEAREVDRLAVEEYGMSSLVLMENAGLLAALRCMELRRGAGPVWILCGAGNNGGDGLVVARQLALRGIGLRVVLAREPGPGDCATQLAILRRAGQEVCVYAGAGPEEWGTEAPSLFVDALLGTGFQGELRAGAAQLLKSVAGRLVGRPCPVIALDLPSGMDCDSGAVAAGTLRADWTLSFAGPKRAFCDAAARAWTGEVEVLPIGCPAAALERAWGAGFSGAESKKRPADT